MISKEKNESLFLKLFCGHQKPFRNLIKKIVTTGKLIRCEPIQTKAAEAKRKELFLVATVCA